MEDTQVTLMYEGKLFGIDFSKTPDLSIIHKEDHLKIMDLLSLVQMKTYEI